MAKQENLNLTPDDLLDANLEDFLDAPEFTNAPAGVYSVLLGAMEIIEVNDTNAIKISATVIDVIELSDDTATPPEAGSELEAVYFIFDYPMEQGQFKVITAPLAEATGVSSLRELMEAVNGLECEVVTGIRVNKKYKKEYFEFKEFTIA